MTYAHGTLAAGRIDGCKCKPCRTTSNRYMARRTRLMAYGQWHPFVDAQPVRDHLRALGAAGLGWMRASRLAGVSTGTVSRLLYGNTTRGTGPTKRVRPATAAALLAIRADIDTLADGAQIDAAGTHRRLQALIALGWTQAKLAKRLGMEKTQLSALLRDRRYVMVRTARQVRALYNELWDQAPPETTSRERVAANRARQYAADRGWVLPQMWDDDVIDDPAAGPEVAAPVRRTVALVENSEELIRGQGYSLEFAAGRLGVDTNSLQKIRDRARAQSRRNVTGPGRHTPHRGAAALTS